MLWLHPKKDFQNCCRRYIFVDCCGRVFHSVHPRRYIQVFKVRFSLLKVNDPETIFFVWIFSYLVVSTMQYRFSDTKFSYTSWNSDNFATLHTIFSVHKKITITYIWWQLGILFLKINKHTCTSIRYTRIRCQIKWYLY